MSASNKNKLLDDMNELRQVINKIKSDFAESNDENENEMFYFGLQKTEEFYSILQMIIKNRSENNDII